MFPVATSGGGQCVAFPDACKTPTPAGPVPIPYPNIAMCSDGTGSKKVKIKGKETLRKGDEIRMSSGDEAGSAMGVASNKIKGKAEFKGGYSRVKAEGKAVAHLTVTVGQNGGSIKNNPALGMNGAPGQVKVKTMTHKGSKEKVEAKANGFHSGTSTFQPNAATNAAATARSGLTGNAATKAGEKLGDEGAKNAANRMANQFGGKVNPPPTGTTPTGAANPPLGNPHAFSGSGTVDVICFCANAILVFEAKGCGSGLGTAGGGGVRRVQQGTPRYLRRIADRMARSRNPLRRAAGKKLQQALKNKTPPVRYCEARTDVNASGTGATPTDVREFDP